MLTLLLCRRLLQSIFLSESQKLVLFPSWNDVDLGVFVVVVVDDDDEDDDNDDDNDYDDDENDLCSWSNCTWNVSCRMKTDKIRSDRSDDHYDDDDADDDNDDDIAVEDDVDDADQGRSAAVVQKLIDSILMIGNHG